MSSIKYKNENQLTWQNAYKVFPLVGNLWLRLLSIAICYLGFVCVSNVEGQETPPKQPATQENSETKKETEEEPQLPTLEEVLAEYPSAKDLISKPPLDWIVLKQLRDKSPLVVIVQKVVPRPNTLDKMQKIIDDYPPLPRGASDKEKELHLKKRQQLFKMSIYLPEDEKNREFFLDINKIDHIIYHEDKLLRWIQKYGEEGKFREAFDLLYKLERSVADWPGVQEQHDKLLLIEAQHNNRKGKPESALAILAELYNRNYDYPPLITEVGVIIDQQVAASLKEGKYRRARYFLNRLREMYRDHEVLVRWEERLNSAALKRIANARELMSAKEYPQALNLVKDAARIWPDARGLSDTFRRVSERYQRLEVGVLRFDAEPTSYPFPTDNESRIQQLEQAEFFETQSVNELALYSSPYLSNWVPTHLGRKLTFDLRSQFQSWEPFKPLTAFDVHESLRVKLDPQSSQFDERLAGYIDRVNVKSPNRFEIKFAKVPLRPEALLTFPISHRVANENPDPQSEDAINDLFVPPHRFRLKSSTEKTRTYERVTAEPSGQNRYHVAEVHETKYPSQEKAIQALVRGEISMLPSVRGRLINLLQNDGRFFVQKKSLPQTYVLQFNPDSVMLKNRELRRALAYGVNRQKLLEEILESQDESLGRVISAPFPTDNQAYYSLAENRAFDLTLAYGLVVAARNNLQDKFGKLRMLCVPDVVIANAAKKMVEEWARIGIEVTLVKENDPEAMKDGWDIVLRAHRMSEPIAEIWPYLTLNNVARSQDLVDLPSWLRQELVNLENAGDLRSATKLLHGLHLNLQADVQLIPLWEVNDYVVIRKTITGFTLNPVHPYQNIEHWTVQSWYPTED